MNFLQEGSWSRCSAPPTIAVFALSSPAPNISKVIKMVLAGEFDNAGAMMSVDETLMCSFQVLRPAEKKKGFAGRVSTPASPGKR